MGFFNNPPFSNTSNYSTLAEVYNMRKALMESEQKNTEHMARVLRELRKLRPGASHAVAQHGAAVEKRDVGQFLQPAEDGGKTKGTEAEMPDSYASDIKSIKEAVSDIAQRLSSLIDMTASQQHKAGCVNERSIGDMSDSSIELVGS
jgi:hypothetical protein